ncbi:DNA-3-methyladenine glycosylase family protein, partial [Halobium palmae]
MNTDADSNAEESTDAEPAGDDAEDSPGPYDHLRTTELAPLVAEYGELDLSTEGTLFERLVVSIVRQRISTVQADRIVADLRDGYEIAPGTMLAADGDELRALGLSGQKVEYLRNAARWWRERDPSPETFEGMADAAVVEYLTEISGVGEWTAEMVLMLGLERPDVFPVGDLAVRRGVER